MAGNDKSYAEKPVAKGMKNDVIWDGRQGEAIL